MNSYRMIVLDIDGTLLDSRKNIPLVCLAAMREAAEAGVIIALGTGRALCELRDLEKDLPLVRYAIFASGAGIYDLAEQKAFALRPIPREQADAALRAAAQGTIMPQIVLADRDVIQEDFLRELEEYHMGMYRPMYERQMTLVPDIYAFAREHLEEILKINLYHLNAEDRPETMARLAEQDMEKVYAEYGSVECSGRNVHKGTGLFALCRHLGIDPRETIAVGDAPNDIPMLEAAGLSVAMGNAGEKVKAAAQIIVPPNDEGGCAEAIRLFRRI